MRQPKLTNLLFRSSESCGVEYSGRVSSFVASAATFLASYTCIQLVVRFPAPLRALLLNNMLDTMLLFLIIAFWCLILPSPARGQSSSSQSEAVESVTCYDFDGSHDTGSMDKNYQCPGSQICCNSIAHCLPNKMCLGDGVIIRPICAVYPWNNSTCSPLCPFSE